MDEEFGVVGGFMADDGDWASPGLTDTGGGLRCTRILEHLINSLLKNSGTPVSEAQRCRRGMDACFAGTCRSYGAVRLFRQIL